MLQPNLDQPLGYGPADQPLRALPRHAKLARDLVLRHAADVVEPARPRGIVQKVRIRLDAVHPVVLPPRPRLGAIWKNSAKEANARFDRASTGSVRSWFPR